MANRRWQLFPGSSRPKIPHGRTHGVLWADKWCESILPTRGSQGTSALWLNLPITQFPLRPVCESCDLFFTSKGNNQHLPVFPRNLTCFRPCWAAAGSHSPNHHVLTHRLPWKASPGIGVQRRKSLPTTAETSRHPCCCSRMGPGSSLWGRGLL